MSGKPKLVLPAMLLVLTFAVSATANNTFFLPGDAFFYTRLDRAATLRLAKSKFPIVTYGSKGNGAFLCGYIGHRKLLFQGMTRETKQAFVSVFDRLQTNIEQDPTAGGSMSVFIYSKSYDWKKYGLALQYNEDWVDESVRFGVPREHAWLGSFVEKASPMVRNWRDAELVAPLEAKCPLLPKRHGQGVPTSPIKVDADKCRFLVIPSRNFDAYAEPVDGLLVYEITDGEATPYVRTNGRWKRQ